MVILQVLTSDTTATDAYLLNWLRARWRIENPVRCASQHHGIGTLVDYLMDIAPTTAKSPTPCAGASQQRIETAPPGAVKPGRGIESSRFQALVRS